MLLAGAGAGNACGRNRTTGTGLLRKTRSVTLPIRKRCQLECAWVAITNRPACSSPMELRIASAGTPRRTTTRQTHAYSRMHCAATLRRYGHAALPTCPEPRHPTPRRRAAGEKQADARLAGGQPRRPATRRVWRPRARPPRRTPSRPGAQHMGARQHAAGAETATRRPGDADGNRAASKHVSRDASGGPIAEAVPVWYAHHHQVALLHEEFF